MQENNYFVHGFLKTSHASKDHELYIKTMPCMVSLQINSSKFLCLWSSTLTSNIASRSEMSTHKPCHTKLQFPNSYGASTSIWRCM